VTAGRYGAIPHTYVLCTKDRTNPVAPQRRVIAEIDAVSGTPTTVVELDSSHSPFLSRPADLAAVIAGACRPRPRLEPGFPVWTRPAQEVGEATSRGRSRRAGT
jgi:hypothetical protein